jgi:hypothetical protein
LPIAAPLLGSYGAGALPVAFSTQASSTAAGKYAVEVSAIGYLTQSVNVDISTTDAIQNFILLTP